MSATWFLYSPLSPRAIQELADDYDRRIEAYADEHADDFDDDDAVPEVSPGGSMPPAAEVQAAYAHHKLTLPRAILTRYKACRSVLTLDRPGDLEDPSARGLVSTLRFLLPRMGDGALLFQNDVPLVPVEQVLARLEERAGLPGFNEDEDEEEGGSSIIKERDLRPGEARARRVSQTLEALMDHPELALDLRAVLQRSPKLAQKYAALLLEEGPLSDAKASKELEVAQEELIRVADELDETLNALKE